MTAPFRRLAAAVLGALAVLTFTVGCTAGSWDYDVPPAAGIQLDDGDVKVRNLLVVADEAGSGLLLGSIFSTNPSEVTGVAIAAEQADGSYTDAVTLKVSEKLTPNQPLQLEGATFLVKDANLQQGLLAKVAIQLGGEQVITAEVPVIAASHADFAASWQEAQ